jgi:PEP-CTERM motif
MFHKVTTLSFATVALCYGLGLDTRTKADLNISTPAGLTAGDTFRIVFVTDAFTFATSASIGTYNAFVAEDARNQAMGGNVVYDGTVLTWSAIASTPSTSAITNIGETGASVWLNNGPMIAATDTTTGLWSGTILSPIDTDLRGNTSIHFVWTGTDPNGTSDPAHSLGSPADLAVAGNTTFTTSDWVDRALLTPSPGALPHNLYGISQLLTVPQQTVVPEPSSLVLGVFGAVSGVLYRRSRRRREQRRQRPVEPTVAKG